ncbi:MAG: hypothetical protein ACI4JF_05985 [Oscillospiraceae bacterium]
MKKILAVIILSVILTGCANAENIPAPETLMPNGDEYAAEQLSGYTDKQLAKAWGKPDGFLSGFYGDIWNTSDDGDHIVIYYNENSAVMAVHCVHVLHAEILEVSDNTILVKPLEGQWELGSADKIFAGTDNVSEEIKEQFAVGAQVEIGYDGLVMETYPAQVNAKYGITLAK